MGAGKAERFSRRELKSMSATMKKINALGPEMAGLTDGEILARTENFRQAVDRKEKTLDDILPEAFAMVREAAKRATGLTPYDVQVMGGIAMYKGCVAEMKTGEGKTMAAAFPAYLVSMLGLGVHIITVNDYLVTRDADDIGRIFRKLGLSVGRVTHESDGAARRQAYACDVTYVTNDEVGFDYLRDNMVMRPEDRVLSELGLNFAIIDEADSILIDEARTALIISGHKDDAAETYSICDRIVCGMSRGEGGAEITKADALAGRRAEETGDYVVDEKKREVHLTDEGIKKVERTLGIRNYADDRHEDLRHYMQMALQAYGLMAKDRDYVVKDGAIVIVDGFTGRMMPGRRFSDGLHQALEAKEHLDIQAETRTLSMITYQNFFNKYARKAGMTGTAMTSWEELDGIYGLKVVSIPTNRPMIRDDEEDAVYLTKAAKRKAVVDEIVSVHATGQPILVGTTTIEESEILSAKLDQAGIGHSVLNAKNHSEEAAIVACAGEAGKVTIATNMAGRGTDIKLSDEARAAGGLYVIGTERHEARRIDNQLRGRSGRQGDPGRSKFFLSLEDDVTRLFGSDRMISMLRAVGSGEYDRISHPAVSRMVSDAQHKIESNYFGVRKSLMEYDAVNDELRELFYAQREAILEGSKPQHDFSDMAEDVAESIMSRHWGKGGIENPKAFQEEWLDVFRCNPPRVGMDRKQARLMLRMAASKALKDKLRAFHLMSDVARAENDAMIRCLDWRWLQHIDYLEHLRQAVAFIGYGQQNPVLVYREKAYEAFGTMLMQAQYDAVKLLFRMEYRTGKAVAV